MSISALTSGTSGLTANQRALDVAANNIANANTPGFQPQSANFQEASPAGTGVTLSVEGRKLASESVSGTNANALKAAESRPNGVGLASELTDNLVYKAGFNLSANVVKAADQALGSLIDVKT
ncbi:flagellar basal body protein [Janthinobacterium sp. PSPC1-1]|uniref:flagellar basal body protein n=1 Tax=Janthinobacterium sp. PSPC1-1 TaxID=2804581 RepID=UPI003CE94409